MRLALDLTNQKPAIYISHTIYLPNDDIAMHIDSITQAILPYTFADIDTLLYCTGPGPFSSLRISSILARLLYRSQPICIVPYHALEVLAYMSGQSCICMRAGLRGYYIWQPSMLQPALVSELPAGYADLSDHVYDLVEGMQKMYAESPRECIKTVSDIQPLYIREPNITKKTN